MCERDHSFTAVFGRDVAAEAEQRRAAAEVSKAD